MQFKNDNVELLKRTQICEDNSEANEMIYI